MQAKPTVGSFVGPAVKVSMGHCHLSCFPSSMHKQCELHHYESSDPLDQCYAMLLILYFKSCLVECAEEKTLETPLPRIWWDFFFFLIPSSIKCTWSVIFLSKGKVQLHYSQAARLIFGSHFLPSN